MSVTEMSYGRHARGLLALGVPLAGSQLAHAAVGLTDTIMLGWYSVETLAAGVLATSFFFTLFVVGSGFSLAVMPMVASANSANDPVQVRRITRMGLWLSFLAASGLMPLMWWSEPILRLLGQDPEIAALAQDYLRIAGWSMFPALLVKVLQSYLAALERAQVILWITVLGGVGNALANWALIFGNWGFPELGIIGAAIATLLNQCLMLAGLCLYAVRILPEHALFQRLWRPDWEAFQEVYRLGWPIGLTHLAESGLFTAAALMMGWLGTLQLAAHGIAMQITSTAFMVHIGLSQAATVRAGQAYGLGDVTGLLRGGRMAFTLSLGMIGLTLMLFLGIPELLVGLFLDPNEPNRAEIIQVGVGLMAIAALFQLADGTQVMAMGLLRGVQDTRTPMVMAALSYWVLGMPAGYVLGFWTPLEEIGVWAGLVAGLFCASALLLHRFWLHRAWYKRLPS
ncbi:MAG: MATE family efflux transporter [Alphaproteobacteria bacterium TMED89]|nr:MATE family efflux transporter [Rhodospirillaceae bacterium]RPH20377.1 MAG: MATE family efflux transporter [Alphaproteobacteria bacterium TMED89]